MVIFKSDANWIDPTGHQDDLIRQCMHHRMDIADICNKYRQLYSFHAIDGHDTDEEERTLLEKYEGQIQPHPIVAENFLAGVCSDADAQLDICQCADCLGLTEAVGRLRDLAAPHPQPMPATLAAFPWSANATRLSVGEQEWPNPVAYQTACKLRLQARSTFGSGIWLAP